ncbi:MAG: penicillin-binding transpeptidase domain-containing protein, partial [Pseudobdellovibrionaceae bacterium]
LMAGKTGTSQVMSFSADQVYLKCENKPMHIRHHGWLVAYAPAENPEITVAVLAEHACHGGSGAGPTVKEVMNTYFQKYHPDMIEAAKIAKKNAPPTIPTAPPPVEEE